MNEQAATQALERALRGYDRASGGFFLEEFLGCKVRFDDEACVLSVEVEDFMFNSAGTLHGGVISFLLDSAAGFLFKRVQGPGYTLENKVQYLRSLGRGPVTCSAHFLKRGRLVSYIETKLHAADGKLAAVATATWHAAEAKA
jgi:acyl-CoA thioesterase